MLSYHVDQAFLAKLEESQGTLWLFDGIQGLMWVAS
jgi:hypothetical protein